MSKQTTGKVHWSFWAISVFALLWNVLGSVNFFMQMNVEIVATLPETHRAIIEGRPVWATGGFALGVFGGSIGALLLLLKKSISFYVFIASVAGVVVTMIHTVNVASATKFDGMEVFVMIILPVIAGVFFVWYAKKVQSKNWTC